MFIVDNRKTLHEMPRSGKILIKDLLLLDYRVVLEKFKGLTTGSLFDPLYHFSYRPVKKEKKRLERSSV